MMKRLKYSPEHEPRMNGDEWAGLRLLANAAANQHPNNTVGKGQATNTRTGSTQLSGNISLQGGNTQAKQAVSLQANGDLTATAAAIGAGGNATLQAGNHLTLTTTTTQSGGNTTLIAGNNLTLASTAQTDSGTRGDVKWTNSREVGNTLHSGGNLTLIAGNDLGIRASTASSDGQLTASAGNNLMVEAGENDQSHEYHRSETKKSWGGLKKKTTTTDHFEEHLTHTASTLSGKGGVSLEAGNDTTLVGSKLQSGGNLDITTGGQLAILAAEDKHVVQHNQKSKSSFAGINYGKSNSSSTSTQTRVAGSASEAMGDMATTSGGSSTFQASSLQAGGTLNVKAGGGVNIVSGTNTNSLNSQSSSSAWGGALSSNSTDTVQQSTVTSSTFNAQHINIDASSIVVEASQIEAQTVALIADSVTLISGKNSLHENHTSDDSGILLREIDTSGQIKQDAVAATITAESLTLNGKQLADASLSTEALLQRISSEGKLTDAQLQTLKAELQNQRWHEKQTTLSKMGSLIVQAITTYLTAGIGSTLTPGMGEIADLMIKRAVNAAANQATQALLTAAITGNKVELNFDELLKNAVKTGVLAGVNAKLDLQFGFSDLAKNDYSGKLMQATLHTATQTAVNGGDFVDNLRNSLVDLAGQEAANLIGNNEASLGTIGYNTAHAALGCALASASKGDCSAGALGAVAAELTAKLTSKSLDGTLGHEDEILLMSQLTAIGSAALLNKDIESAYAAGNNAVINNFLNHTEQMQFADELNGCGGSPECIATVREKYKKLSDENNVKLNALYATCQADENRCGEFRDFAYSGLSHEAQVAIHNSANSYAEKHDLLNKYLTTRNINDEVWHDANLDLYLGRDLAEDASAALQQAGQETITFAMVLQTAHELGQLVKGMGGKAVTKSLGSFADQAKLLSHFEKHGAEFGAKSADEYLLIARDVMKNGTKIQYKYKGEVRTGFVQLMGNTGKGQSKFAFVGTNSQGQITTLHTKSGKDFWKTLNENFQDKTIYPVQE